MIASFHRIFGIIAVCIWAGLSPVQASAGPVKDRIEALTKQISEPGLAAIGAETLLAEQFIIDFYAQRQFAPVWFGTAAEVELITELRAGVSHGFLPQDFHLTALPEARFVAEQGDPADIARYDVLATDAAVRLIYYNVFGKVNPAEFDQAWNFDRPIIEADPVAVMETYLNGEGFSALIARISIKTPQYTQLIDALAQYQMIVSNGGWPELPSDEVIKPGMTSPVVALLRDRLEAEGVLRAGKTLAPVTAINTDPREVYDAALQEDVRAFQTRHGLDADGVIGGRSFQALNRTAAHRVDQLRLSLERGRWLMRDLEGDFILVNIAGARTYLVREDGTLWMTRSITGSQYRKTPIFRDEIKYMEFNPTWTVPRSIFLKDKLETIRRDAGYLGRNDYIVRDSEGRTIPAHSVDWTASNPNVTLVQQPGPDNALGLVKFMFPNEYAVYLHDTNNKSLFSRNERNLSSGCVRLEYPFELVMLLMENDPDWSFERMQSILDSKKTTRIDLAEPMPVLLTYWTAWVEDGAVQFREDIYERDDAILGALNK
ncbi:L,D-transpeptidase family protein [Tateyamaria pelophila]|uniref:L,D-transpeptidase family protein n=1 Tax=Tateyamaria pelophila TaxID=328415 RepID=UPI001CBA8FDF|nr:L,D-transpeptidase family protein [Tateyamaria pelophila]